MNIGGCPRKSIVADKISAAPPRIKIGIPPSGTGLIIVAVPLNIRNHACIAAIFSGMGETVKRSSIPESRSSAPIGSNFIGSIFFCLF